MKSLLAVIVLVGLAVTIGMLPATAGDIVTMPTANQLRAGEVDLAQYHIWFRYPPGPPLPTHAWFSTMYVGVTDRAEIDVWYINPNKVPSQTVINATGLLTSERKGDYADVVVGIRDLGDNLERLFGPDFERSYFVAAAKTLNPPPGPPTKHDTPIWRVHLGLGTHLGLATNLDRIGDGGVFGGLQALVTPQLGAIALWDGTDDIIGLTYTRKPDWPTVKGGVFGDHWWVGVNYTFTR
jgi:hypothetical protein